MSFTFPEESQMQVAVFLLALVRMSGIFLVAPFYTGPAVPLRLKIGFAVFLTAAVAPLLMDQGAAAMARFASPLAITFAAMSELAIGFAIGMVGAILIGAIQTAGYMIAQDIGFTIANVIDPITSIQTSVIGQLKVSLALFIFIGLNFHHAVVRIIAESFRLIPLGSLGDRFLAVAGGARMEQMVLTQGSHAFETAVRLSLPVTVTLLLVTVAMGFLARAVPEMNVFIFGFGLRVLVGLWVIFLLVPLMAEMFRVLFERATREGEAMLRALAGG